MELEEAIKQCKLLLFNLPNVHLGGSEAIETVLHELENYKEGNIVSLKLLENFYLVNKDKEKQMTLANKKIFDDYIPKKKIEDKIKELKIKKLPNGRLDLDIRNEAQINILQELLEDK